MYRSCAAEPRMKTADSISIPLATKARWAGAGRETARTANASARPSQ